jgi:hypothetical protein
VVVQPPQHISSSLFFGFFFLIYICDGDILGKKKVKVVELQQFENLGRLNVTFETLKVKVKMSE